MVVVDDSMGLHEEQNLRQEERREEERREEEMCWRGWELRSPLLFFLSFGAHSFRASLPLLQVYFLDTGFVTSTGCK